MSGWILRSDHRGASLNVICGEWLLVVREAFCVAGWPLASAPCRRIPVRLPRMGRIPTAWTPCTASVFVMSGEDCGSFREPSSWVFASPNRLETLPALCLSARPRHPIDRSCACGGFLCCGKHGVKIGPVNAEDPVAGGVALNQTRSLNLEGLTGCCSSFEM
ncbi:hypothetical protein BDZ85DRAFT_36163 [Elsinoe ampelina]|uniref:Uncharacterized protein n=1 Tax=Elsinoe ampelina TaxID=302913 RepID=A0A6A6G2D0_9PEZI|nr:hypothetical protein BDZ85DRAFT_36163 [Elsinoe ampelina]